MKFVPIFVVLLLFVNQSVSLPYFVNCTSEEIRSYQSTDECGQVKCEGSGQYFGVGCGTWECAPGKHVGYKQADNSKPFPDCCGGPICGDQLDLHVELE